MELELNKVHLHDVSQGIPLPDESCDLIMTSPPYY
jgi:DNA modification methylase